MDNNYFEGFYSPIGIIQADNREMEPNSSVEAARLRKWVGSAGSVRQSQFKQQQQQSKIEVIYCLDTCQWALLESLEWPKALERLLADFPQIP